MRYKRRLIKTVLFILFILTILYTCYHWINSVSIYNEKVIQTKLEQRYNITNIQIIQTRKYKNLFLILYINQNNQTCLNICKKDLLFRHRYTLEYGSTYTDDNFSTYISSNEGNAMIIAYGNNSTIRANKYMLNNGDESYSKNIQEKTSVIDVYEFPEINIKLPTNGNRIQLFDEYNNIIE